MGGGLNWLISLLRDAVGGKSGSHKMTVEHALSYPPVWNAVSKITGIIGYLPLNVHRANGRTIEKLTNHTGYRLLRVKPNGYQTPMAFKRQLMMHALMSGNGRAFIERRGSTAFQLHPLMGDRCRTMLVDGQKVHLVLMERNYEATLDDDLVDNMGQRQLSTDGAHPNLIPVLDKDVLHIPGLSFDGVEGISLISAAARSWSLGIGAEEQERNKQRKGYTGGLMLEAPEGALRDEAEASEFLHWFRKNHDGDENAGRTGLLREGIKANAIAMSNGDAQFLEQRMFQRQDTALFFLLEQILGDDSSVSYNSLEQKNLAFLQNCLSPWMKTWEEECDIKLLSEREQSQGLYFKFNEGALLRSDKATTMTVAVQGVTARIFSPNEARELFDMNPYDGGDEFANPAITPGSPEDRQQDNTAAEATVRNLLKVESRRVIDAANAKNFLAKVDAFYSGWEERLAKRLAEINPAAPAEEIAARHCEESKQQLLDCCECSAAELVGRVTECVAGWPDRVEGILESMRGACDVS